MNIEKAKETFFKIWKDPVWAAVISGLITAAILAIGAAIFVKFSEYTFLDVYNVIIRVLTFKAPIYLFLSIVALYYIARLCNKLFKPKQKEDPLWSVEIGNYTFRELFDILSSQFYPLRTVGMEWGNREAPKDNLLMLFHFYNIYFIDGVTSDYPRDDSGYGWGVLAPKLMTYGLVNQFEEPLPEYPDITNTVYRTSDLGHKFYATLEKLFLKHPEMYNELKSHNFKEKEQV